MKAPFLVLVGSLSLLISSDSLGCGGSCGDDTSDCQQNSCVESQNYCQCADINSSKNPCICKNDYCDYFGNAGDNKFNEWPNDQ